MEHAGTERKKILLFTRIFFPSQSDNRPHEISAQKKNKNGAANHKDRHHTGTEKNTPDGKKRSSDIIFDTMTTHAILLSAPGAEY